MSASRTIYFDPSVPRIGLIGDAAALRFLLKHFDHLARNELQAWDILAGGVFECVELGSFRAVNVQPPRRRGPALVRGIVALLRPHPPQGLLLVVGSPPGVEWRLDSDYWRDFADLLAPLLQNQVEGSSCILCNGHRNDAELRVEFREHCSGIL
jgi:hypothetical protein